MSNYIFDVDGTLTPSRGVMDEKFREWFRTFQKTQNTYLVTGSSKENTIKQVGEDVYNASVRVYNCSGNDVYEGDKQVSHNDWILPDEVENYLSDVLVNSIYEHRTGWHWDHRTGMCNFSVLGRNAGREKRKDYFEWDKKTREREGICDVLNAKYPYLSAKVGGETGIDIFGKDKDKGQILIDFAFELDTIKFYGDRVDPKGNDYPIAILLQPHQVNAVSDWEHTWALLSNIDGGPHSHLRPLK